MPPLVSAAELAALLDRGEAMVADVRWYLDGRRGIDAYENGHIPGAVFVDVDRALAAPPGNRGRHPLPSPEHFADAMAALGIGDDDFVVAYDDAGGGVAARLWWMLHVTGHHAAVLDGGLRAWDGDLDVGAPIARSRTTFSARPWPSDSIVDVDDLARMSGNGREGGAVIVDARDPARYRGEVEPIDPRPGHIPGAKNAPWTDNLGRDGRFRDAGELRSRFESLGVSAASDRDVVVYCGSGITACHDALALTIAGIERVRLYAGSWSEWSAEPSRPAALGSEAE